jgi:uncharacterized protein YjiS (DUF1127 family)
VTIVYFRDLRPERIASAISSRRTDLGSQPHRGGQAPADQSWLVRLREWRRRRRSRTSLSLLNDRMLKDIGVSYAEAEREVNKPFWLP